MISFTAQDWYNLLADPKGFVITIAPAASPYEFSKRKGEKSRGKTDHPYGYAAKVARAFLSQSRYNRSQFAQMNDLPTEALSIAIRRLRGVQRRENRVLTPRYSAAMSQPNK